MTVRDTSKEAYAEIRAGLSQREAEITSVVGNGVWTRREIAAHLKIVPSSLTAAVLSLIRKGVIKEHSDKVICGQTGRRCYGLCIRRSFKEYLRELD